MCSSSIFKTWLSSLEKTFFKKQEISNPNNQKFDSVYFSNSVKNTNNELAEPPDMYADQHKYKRMHPSAKKKPKPTALLPLPHKDIYKCLAWQTHPYDIKKLTEYVDTNTQLYRVKSNSIVEAAHEADILILSSGSGKYHVDSLLCEIDTSKKIIIIASIRELESVKKDISHRIDYHFNKLKPFSQQDFNALINRAITENIKHVI